jgi:hypothetical protein
MELEKRTSTLENENSMLKDTIKRLKVSVVELNGRLRAAGLAVKDDQLISDVVATQPSVTTESRSGSETMLTAVVADKRSMPSSADALLLAMASMPPPPAINIPEPTKPPTTTKVADLSTSGAASVSDCLSVSTCSSDVSVGSGQLKSTQANGTPKSMVVGSVGAVLQRLLPPGCSPQHLSSRSARDIQGVGALHSLAFPGGGGVPSSGPPTNTITTTSGESNASASDVSAQPMVDALSSLRANPLSSLMTL